MALINLKTTPRVRPITVKGSRISHSSGNRKISARANGQHITSNIHHRMRAIRVLIV